MLPTVVLVAALAASALGSPAGSVSLDKGAQPAADNAEQYTLSVFRSGQFVGPAVLISDKYAVVAAHLINGAKAEELSVTATKPPSTFGYYYASESIAVSRVAEHPSWESGADVAVLQVSGQVSGDLGVDMSSVEAPLPGTRAAVSAWSWSKRWFLGWTATPHVADGLWVVLPRYCDIRADSGNLCVSGSVQDGALLAVDGHVVGLATKQGADGEPVSYVNLADPLVSKFIAAATSSIPSGDDDDDATTTKTTTRRTTTTITTTTTNAAPTAASSKSDKTTAKPKPTDAPHDDTTDSNKATCKINVNGGLPSYEPLLLRADNANGPLTFREPDNGNVVTLRRGELVRFACPGSGNAFTFDKSVQDVVAECKEDDVFIVNGKTAELHRLGCKVTPSSTLRRAGKCLDGRYTRIEAGFVVDGGFAVLYENCFNENTFDAIYSRSNMTAAIAGHESGVKRPGFAPGEFFEGVSIDHLYTQKEQRKTIGALLGDSSLGDKYISNKGNLFLARGHYSAKADYIQGIQQRATFYHVNIAPQWQTFNGGNWDQLEISVRDWVIAQKRSVQVITGTWDVATLPDKSGVETPLYLGGSRKIVRVPKYYWKVVYEPETKRGVAFVGLNNPWQKDTADEVFCKDVCSQYKWLLWKPKDASKGIGFCCDVNELRKVVDTLPADVKVDGLLS